MKLSFSTLGCREWNLSTIVERAREYGYEGVEFRGHMEELQLWKVPEFSTGIAETRAMFKDAGLKIPCLGSDAKMYARQADRAKWLEEIRRYADVAYGLGTPFIRVFGGVVEEGVAMETALGAAAEFLNSASVIARSAGAVILVETHDAWVDSRALLEAFKTARFPRGAGVLWDVHHPFRQNGEDPDDTWKNIGQLVKYTHWKDSQLENVPKKEETSAKRRVKPCLMGCGDIPLRRMIEILSDSGYEGWCSLEWERRWHPEIESPEVAFPQYVKFMRNLLSKVSK